MKKNMNQSSPLHGSIAQQPKAMRVSSPQQLKGAPVSAPQEHKANPVPTPQQTRDIPRSRPPVTAGPTHDDIAKRAYEIYVSKGCPEGQSEQIWTQAEQELKK